MTYPDRLRTLLRELDRAGSCSHPIRLVRVGPEGERVVLVACKDRRSSVCPACSHTYKGDAWQLVAAGLHGGKGIPAEVSGHPRAFVTLTAPSFGAVHGRAGGEGRVPCHPRGSGHCPHGRPKRCAAFHDESDPLLGQPVCPGCFDYVHAVLWNAQVSVLWQRTTKAVVRELAHRSGEEEGGLRLSYVKAAEFQRRGLVHLHVVLRADGAGNVGSPPPDGVTASLLADAIVQSAAQIAAPGVVVQGVQPRSLRWGSQLAAVELPADVPESDQSLAVAAYLAKYATKTADSTGALVQPIRRRRDIDNLVLSDHHRRLVATAWDLGGHRELSELRLRRCAHAFGFRGHVLTKSRHYSTTFSALRNARADYRRGPEPVVADDVRYGFAGRGYDDPDAGILAFELARAATLPPAQRR